MRSWVQRFRRIDGLVYTTLSENANETVHTYSGFRFTDHNHVELIKLAEYPKLDHRDVDIFSLHREELEPIFIHHRWDKMHGGKSDI